MSKSLITVFGLLVVAGLGLLLLSGFGRTSPTQTGAISVATAPATAARPISPMPQGDPIKQSSPSGTVYTGIAGRDAIVPPTSAAALSPDTPAFTKDAVIAYVLKNPIGGKIAQEGTPTVEKIELLKNTELSQKLNGTTIGTAQETLVWYVVLNGTYSVSAPGGTPQIFHKAMIVFDAHTGNILDTGIGDTYP